jgi:Uma2 family endonuclease
MADQGSLRTEPRAVRFTGQQVLAMQQAGVLPRSNRVELIGGELIDMGSEGALHLPLRVRLTNWLIRRLPEDFMVNPDGVVRLSDTEWPEPDISVFPSSIDPLNVRGGDLLLVIEISDTSLAFDLGEKAALYARRGVREYWVVDATTGRTHIHLRPEGEAWQSVSLHEPHDVLQATLLAAVSLTIEAFR